MAGRRRNRLLVLVVSVAFVAVAAGGAYSWRQSQLDGRALESREAGLEAYEREEWPAALDGLGRYIGRFGDRANATEWMRYARSRRNVELPDGQQVPAAIRAMRRAFELDPADIEVGRELVGMYVDAGLATEALDTSEEVLSHTPDDLRTLRYRLSILASQRRFTEALDVARQINHFRPGDLAAYFDTLQLMGRSALPAEEIRAWADGLARDNRDDRRFVLLQGAAYGATGDHVTAERHLDAALAADVADPVFARILVEQLDRLGRFRESLALLERLDFASQTPALRRALIHRLWFERRFEDIETRLARLDAADPAADAELLALRTMTRVEAGLPDDSAAVVARLSAPAAAAADRAWGRFLADVFVPGTTDPALVLQACRQALELDPDNSFVRQRLGDAYLRLGESDLAIEAWSAVSSAQPAWARPLTLTARVFLDTGREKLALELSRAGLLRAPTDLAAVGAWVRASTRDLAGLDPKEESTLLEISQRVQNAVPGEPETLDTYVRLLAHKDRGAAEAHVRRVLSREDPASAATLTHLYATCLDLGLDVAGDVARRCDAVHGRTPPLAFAHAVDLAADGDAAAGTALLRAGREASGPELAAEWDLCLARFFERIDDPAAGRNWIATADTRADDARIQLAALDSQSVWNDREGVLRVIGRVRALTGEGAVTWRVARARWLLEDPVGARESVTEAAALLSGVVGVAPSSYRARLLLASALERLGNAAGAAEQLQIAANMLPDAGPVLVELARLAQDRGDLVTARANLDRFASGRQFAQNDVRRAVRLLLAQCDHQRVVYLLDRVATRRKPTDAERRQLALACLKSGDLGRAELVVRGLVEGAPDGAADASALGLLARLRAASGDRPGAELILDRIAAEGTPEEATRERALYLAAIGDDAGAAAKFRELLGKDESDDTARTGLLRVLAATGDTAGFRAALTEATRLRRQSFGVYADQIDVLSAMVGDVQLRALAATTADTPEALTAITDAGRALMKEPDRSKPSAAAVAAAARLADALPRLLPVQLLQAELLGQRAEYDAALAIVALSVREFPLAVEPVRLRAQLLGAKGDWRAALDAALKWRERGRMRHSEVDTLIAECRIRLGDVAAGLSEIEAYLKPAKEHPEGFRRLLVAYGWGLLLEGHDDRAMDLLGGLARDDAGWREILLGYEVSRLPDAAVAARWLDGMERLVGDAGAADLLRLAVEWQRLALQSASAEYRARFEALAARVCGKSDARAQDLFTTGLLYDQLGATEQASDSYRRAIAGDDRLQDARNNLAVILTGSGDWEQAVRLSRRTVEADPRNAEYLDTLAAAYLAGGRRGDAADCLRRAAALETGAARWNVALAELLLQDGDAPGARREARVATERLALPHAGEDTAALRRRLAQVERQLPQE